MELEGQVQVLQTGTMALQKVQDVQALEISSSQTELADMKENNTRLQRENQVETTKLENY